MFTTTIGAGERSRIVLADDSGAGSRAELAPWRGGMLTRFSVGGEDVFYLDEASFDDVSKNVRGGVPVLFPSPGKLTGDSWSRDGKSGSMHQHGFARELAWEVVSTGNDGGAKATLAIVSTDATRARYPWSFRAEYTYTLRASTLRIDQAFTNTGGEPMPFGAGFHPYFRVLDREKASARVATAATSAFDNKAKHTIDLRGAPIDLTASEVDLHLIDHGSASATLDRGVSPAIVLRGSEEFGRWVIWTLTGKDFVCLEPWTCPGDALNTGESLMILEPGGSRSLWLEISVGG